MEQQNPLDRIFGRLLTASSTEPYGLPVFKSFPAPMDTAKFDAFTATLQANDWNVDAALAPYSEDELDGMVVFHDPATDEYKFCPTLRFWRLNGIHTNMMPADEE